MPRSCKEKIEYICIRNILLEVAAFFLSLEIFLLSSKSIMDTETSGCLHDLMQSHAVLLYCMFIDFASRYKIIFNTIQNT